MLVPAVGLALAILFMTLVVAFVYKNKIRLQLLSREAVEDKEFLAIRIESDDFLFLKEEGDVRFIQSLKDVDEFREEKLYVQKEAREEHPEDALKLPKREKAS